MNVSRRPFVRCNNEYRRLLSFFSCKDSSNISDGFAIAQIFLIRDDSFSTLFSNPHIQETKRVELIRVEDIHEAVFIVPDICNDGYFFVDTGIGKFGVDLDDLDDWVIQCSQRPGPAAGEAWLVDQNKNRKKKKGHSEYASLRTREQPINEVDEPVIDEVDEPLINEADDADDEVFLASRSKRGRRNSDADAAGNQDDFDIFSENNVDDD